MSEQLGRAAKRQLRQLLGVEENVKKDKFLFSQDHADMKVVS